MRSILTEPNNNLPVMVTKIMKSSGSAGSSLEYNGEKYYEGEADIVCVRNIESASQFVISRTILDLEKNPAINAKTKNFSFHMTVNPADGEVEDEMDEANVLDYIDDMMKELGYAKQPYVIYRHHDIDRIHYHVVSSRIQPNGKVIRDCYDRPKTMAAQKRLAKKYGFTPGGEGVADKVVTIPPARIYRGMPNLIEQVKANAEDMLTWNIASALQYRASMMSLGVRMSRGDNPDDGKHRKKKYWSLTPIDKDGKSVCWPIKGSRVMDSTYDDRLRLCMQGAKDKKKSLDEEFLSEAVKLAIAESNSVTEVRNALLQLGLYLHLEDEKKKQPRKASSIAVASIVDVDGRTAYTITEAKLSLDRLRALPLRTDTDREAPLAAEKVNALLAKKNQKKIAPTVTKKSRNVPSQGKRTGGFHS